MKHKKIHTPLLHVRDDVWVNINNIDSIVRTNKDPKDNSTLSSEMYIIYLKESKYKWIGITPDDFTNLIKPYI